MKSTIHEHKKDNLKIVSKTIIQKIFKTLTLITVYCSLSAVLAQAPQKMNYQAVVRNANNELVANTIIGMKISILKTSATGTAVYEETQTPTTNNNGLAVIEIGNGTVVSGSFSGIDWANDLYFVKTETDPLGGTNYSISGTSQLTSVPYALSSADNKWAANANGINNISGNVGIGTIQPDYKLDVVHSGSNGVRIKSTSGYSVLDIDSQSGESAIRFAENGVNKWIIDSGTDDNSFNINELGANGGSRISIKEGTGNVGIGVSNPLYKLHVGNSQNAMRIEGASTTGGTALSIGGNGKVEVDAPGVLGGRFNIQENGNVGIGTATPNAPLSFPPTLGKKITLYPGQTGDVGFGVAGNRLQLYTDNPNADVAIGYDAAGVFNEKLAVKANGAIAVNSNTGTVGQVLTSGGVSSPAVWSNAPKQYSTSFSDSSYQWKGLPKGIGSDQLITLSDLTQTIPAQTLDRALISYNLLFTKNGSALFNIPATASIYLCVNGSFVNVKKINLTSDDLEFGEITLSNFTYNLPQQINTIEIKVSKSSALVNNFIVWQQSSTVLVYPE